MAIIKFEIPDTVAARARFVFGDKVIEAAQKAFKRAIGEAEIQAFIVTKQAEVKAEERRLNEDLGLIPKET